MENNFNKEVGAKIYNARKALDISRAELGKKVNLHETSVKKYEDGNIKYLDVEKLSEFAAALNIDPLYLIGHKKDVEKKPNDFESKVLVLARQSGKALTPEQRERLLKGIESTIDMYMDAVGLYADGEDNKNE